MTGMLRAGLLLTLLVTGAMTVVSGRGAVIPGLVFGGVATGLQVVAVRLLRRGFAGGTAEFFKGVGIGMGLRMGGVFLMLGAVALDRATFPPLPTALAYVGVVVPLLFLEVRFVR